MNVISRPQNSTGAVVGAIADLIQQRELKVGDKLPPIRDLATLLDLKINTIRDGLMQAQTLGLVKVLPRAGAFVQQTALSSGGLSLLSLERDFAWELQNANHNLFHLLDARRVLDLELGRRAIERRQLEDLLPIRKTLEAMSGMPMSAGRAAYVDLDIRFHLQIAELGDNDVLLMMLRIILEQLRPYLERLDWDAARNEETNRMHAELYRALAEGDAEAFSREMRSHLGLAYDSLLDVVRSPPVTGGEST